MKQALKSVSYYGRSLLGGSYGGLAEAGAYRLRLTDGAGYYLTRGFDTGEDGCSFNRLVVDGSFNGAKLEVIVAATDEATAVIDNAPRGLEEFFHDAGILPVRKAEHLAALPHVRAVNTRDILLHSLRGRYVWIYVALTPGGGAAEDCALGGLLLELPKVSFTEYFPEIYHGNEFFDRYIAIFQSLFLDVEKRVDRIPELLDYRTTPDENVALLAGWLGISNTHGLFTPAQLRHLIENLELYQGSKGTKHALERVTQLLTGVRPRVIEYFEWARPGLSEAQLEVNRRLYGETPNHFCVILNLTWGELNVPESDLRRLIEEYSPLDSQCSIVALKICCHTDTHCYLDVNSALSVPEAASVDGGAFGGHFTIG